MALYPMLSVFLFGLILGLKHALEADHVIAVSTMATRQSGFKKAALTGIYWGAGHTTTIFLMGLPVFLFKTHLPADMAVGFEFVVGLMLLYLGISAWYQKEKNRTDGSLQPGIKSMIIGMIHGLAGGSAVILLAIGTVDSIWYAAGFILLFGVGTILGMLAFSSVIGLSLAYSHKMGARIQQRVTGWAALLSILYGLFLIGKIGLEWIG
ncbi:MAG: urease accessory protein UreH [Bacillaceae bacterium]|nr:urease accessory protein UreH [Bacillaceae bacterium]